MKKIISHLMLAAAVLMAGLASAQTFPVQNLQVNGTSTLSGNVSGTGVTNLFATPPAIGASTPSTGAFTNFSITGTSSFGGAMSGAGLTSHDANVNHIQTVANVAALRAISCIPGLLYADQGYYTIGGGGASTYVCNGSDTTSTDNGVTILASANTNRLYLLQAGPVSTKQAGAKCDGTTDDTTAINNLFANVKYAYVSSGGCKITATLTAPPGLTVTGSGVSSSLLVWGSHGITVGGDFVTISNIAMFSFTSGGSGDPRTFRAINAPGTSGTHINYLFVQNVFTQGWSDCAYLAYTWTSKIIGLSTVNSNNGVTMFGQSVNNAISDSTLTVNSGNASINLLLDVATAGEGLTVTNSLLSSGAFGIKSATGFLSLNVSNCIIDLVSNIGIDVTDNRAMRISNSWIYATNFDIKVEDLGSSGPENSSIIGNTLQITAASGGQGIYLGTLNSNISVVGNSFAYTGTSVGLFSNAGQVAIDANNFVNSGSGADITVNTNVSTHWLANNTGVTVISGGSVQAFYSVGTWTPADISGASLTLVQTNQANYVKNGRQVTATADITYPSTASGATAEITLPFAPLTGAPGTCNVGFQSFAASFTAATTSNGVAGFFMYSAAGTALTNTNLSTKRVNVTCTYITAS